MLERFCRAEASRNRVVGHTGLGLAIVAVIARAHSGASAGGERAPSIGAFAR